MSKLSYKVTLLAGLAVFTFGGATVSAVGSDGSAAGTPQTTTSTQTSAGEHQNARPSAGDVKQTEAEKQVDVEKRKTENRRQSCRLHEGRIDAAMIRIAQRADNQIDVFTKISDRTEAFYIKKGKTLTNYAALVEAVNTQKAAVLASARVVRADANAFKCDGTNEKAEGTAFRAARHAEIAALKTYKTAVKNLIAGVKSLNSTTNQGAK